MEEEFNMQMKKGAKGVVLSALEELTKLVEEDSIGTTDWDFCISIFEAAVKYIKTSEGPYSP